MQKKVIVVGGGIVGLCCAYYLDKAGHQVQLIDQSKMDSGASHVNAGYLTPSHIIPLAAPGVMTQGIKWMFNSSSPFYLKPRMDWDFFKWAWNFKKSSTRAKVQKAIPIIAELNVKSKALYEQLKSSGDLGDFQLEKQGLLMLFKDSKYAKHELEIMNKAISLGLEAEYIDRERLDQLQPNLNAEITQAVHYLCDAHTTPNQVMKNLKTYLSSRIQICAEEKVTGFERHKHAVSKVYTDKGSYQTDAVVLAGGAWSPQLCKELGLSLSLQAGKGYRIDIKQETPVTLPAVLMEAKVAVTPMIGFTRLAGTMEFSGINHRIQATRVKAIADAATRYYNGFEVQKTVLENASCGLRPVSPDGLPFIGPVPELGNAFIATGHAMMGWSLGPISGKLIQELIDDQPTSMSLEGLSPGRSF